MTYYEWRQQVEALGYEVYGTSHRSIAIMNENVVSHWTFSNGASFLYESEAETNFGPNDFQEWLREIRSIADERNEKLTSQTDFEDIAYDLLDNDSKLDLFKGNVEALKTQIVNRLWRQHKAERDLYNADQKWTKSLTSKRGEENEEATSPKKFENPIMDAGYQAGKQQLQSGEVPTCPYAVSTVRYKLWQDGYKASQMDVWEVDSPVVGEENEEENGNSVSQKLVDASIFVQGMEAAKSSGDQQSMLTSNPHQPNTKEYDLWEKGFKAGQAISSSQPLENNQPVDSSTRP